MMKIFVVDFTEKTIKKKSTPLIYPLFFTQCTLQEQVKELGNWVTQVRFTQQIEEATIITTAEYLNEYTTKFELIDKAVELAKQHNKVMVFFTSGDWGITPTISTPYHLYRTGGYASLNSGNQFAYPNFIKDPLVKYNNNQLSLLPKTQKPIIGFCGQATAGIDKYVADIFRLFKRICLKKMGRWVWDLEKFESTSYTRAKLLRKLEKANTVETKFIKRRKYRGGATTAEEKEKSTAEFYNNMLATQYNVCYRGGGNFSVRLFETLACGRIPILVMSDNNLVFADKINWQQFPIVREHEYKQIAEIVVHFHEQQTPESFLQLQQNARKIWEEYIAYPGFMQQFVNKYLSA